VSRTQFGNVICSWNIDSIVGCQTSSVTTRRRNDRQARQHLVGAGLCGRPGDPPVVKIDEVLTPRSCGTRSWARGNAANW
jgi:hypothetical protein